MSECMTQEDAMNMSDEQAVQILKPLRNMMIDRNGCPISDAVFALDKAIVALSKKMPTVEPERKGKWKETDDGWDGTYYVCSECGCPWTLIDGTPEDNGMNFCPNCGADMRGDQ